jgi:heat shock protein HslJ
MTTMWHGSRSILGAAIVALLLAACAGGTPSAPPTTSGGTGMVDAAGDWRLTDGRDAGVPIPLVPGADITMSVADSQISGRAACNQYGGEIVVKDGQIQFGPLFMTEMACEEPVMASESAYLAALAKIRAASRDGDRLTLSGDAVELAFERLAPPPTAAMTDTDWVLDSLIAADAVSSVAGDPALLRLASDGVVTGSTGCRSFTGRFAEANGEVLFSEFTMDQVDCPPELRSQDDHVVSVLGDGFRAVVDGQRLTVTSTGQLGLGYTAATPAESSAP